LKQQADERQQELNDGFKLGMEIQQNRQGKRDALLAALRADIEEFAENLPQAKSQQLRADLLNSNNLTVSTQVQPIIKIEVLRDYRQPGVRADITRQKGRGFTQSQTPVYDFTAHGFSDGQKAYSPQELAAGLFSFVEEFFSSQP
jgi:hypothetical protein